MNRDDIIRMAREAGPLISTPFDVWCERFAALVAAAERDANKKLWESLQFSDEKIANCIEATVAAERDACAKVCEEIKGVKLQGYEFAIAIRARGEG